MGELQNVCVKIPLFQAIKDIPIYSNFVRELCLKKSGRKRKHPPRVHVIGDFAKLMMGNTLPAKYSDPGSPIVKVKINGISLSNTLIDLGATINVMTKQTMDRLGITNIQQTYTILQFPNQSHVRPDGTIEDVFISVYSWEYPMEFMLLQTKSNLGGYPLILGRPWFATTDAYIGF